MPDAFHAIVIMGVSGVGKTAIAEALAKRRGWTFVDGDAFHPASNVEKMRRGTPLKDDDRWPWLRAIAAEIDRQRPGPRPIVIACSALKRAYRKILTDGRPGVKLVYLQGGRELIMSRLQLRQGHYFPASLLDSQFAALEEPEPAERALVIAIDKSIDAIVDEIVQTLNS
ncbi:gluconokinase [Bradyrhizobium sp. LHD-71]|uniref:gluconokinase n=1 Tax=Bradyrhizobium sp. LHD-71 TaxID=3072141 RepID=UPI00280FA1C8|nr:gluconokinase [Bradyrhizobium sp. LHD-71]MDQ8730418.1 gluconokinase [Bradyrhizobium sp. LHD-71]